MKFLKQLKLHWCIPFLGMLFSSYSLALTPKEAGQKGMDFITKAAVDWQNARGGSDRSCFACHTQGLSIWGASIGTTRGYTVNQQHLAELVKTIVREQDADDLWRHHGGNIAPTMTTAIASSGLAFYDRSVATDAQQTFLSGAEKLWSRQEASGRWVSDGVWKNHSSEVFRFDNNSSVTAMSIITMRRAFEITKAPKYEESYLKAVEWLKGVQPSDTQSLGYKMAGLIEGKVPKSDAAIQSVITTLKARQNPDGGFGVYQGRASSSFQTGVAVYALRLGGLTSTDSAVSRGVAYLLNSQRADGSWPVGAAQISANDRVASNMWAVIALGEFGEFGVDIQATPEGQELLAFSDTHQIINYVFTVTNTGNAETPETFDIKLSGGYPGFPAALDKSVVTLASGESNDIHFTMFAPPNLPFGFPVTHSVMATSQARSETFAITSVTSATPPPPPAVGHNTNVMFIEGENLVIDTNDTVRLAVHVIDTQTNSFVVGSSDPNQSIGNVSFFVGGVNIGGDNDADGDGVFEISWTPGYNWSSLGDQSLLVTYSGIDKPEPQSDLLFSFAISAINIEAAPVTPEVIAEEVLADIADVVALLPVNASPAVFNHYQSAQDAINAALEALLVGDSAAAIGFFEDAILSLQDAISKTDKERCSANKNTGKKGNKGGKDCIEDDLADLTIMQINSVIEVIRQAIALIA
ncbi:hypothetical protein [Alteromonas sp. a30]|uniref:hypothetical protein n=1 Tax=Alteromonas sp. a30 TaxID=2730917 RepID=UPI002282A599|nr:hypothetical protein [Alteromonas sp. a30]MCY7296646.1 hypothetical protein [Alteromonas sp. a30]